MDEIKWIKITTDIFDDEKILLIESLPEADSIIVIWFKLLCLAGKMNNSGVFVMNNKIAYTDKMLATIFRRKEATVQLALKTFENFGMVELIDGIITIPNWGKHQKLEQLEERKRYQREYQREYRNKQKLLAGLKDGEKPEPDEGKPAPGEGEPEPDGEENDSKCLHKHLHEHLHEPNVNTLEGEERELEEDIKESKKEKARESSHTLFMRLSGDYIFSDALKARIGEWITYKTERKEPYKEQGMKSLLRQIENNAMKYGDAAVCELIEECMASSWKGIIFDRLKNKPVRSVTNRIANRVSDVDNW